MRVLAVSPDELRLPEGCRSALRSAGHQLRESVDLELAEVDVVYMAGFPECNPAGRFGVEVRKRYRLDGRGAAALRAGAVVLCPLPRIDEISTEVDDLPVAAYFRQSVNGLPMRMAVLRELISWQHVRQ
jgi:aspartate carbamoyltransferase catalytic subunit